MSFNFLRHRWFLLAGVTVGALVSANGQLLPSQKASRTIRFSEPARSDSAISNLNLNATGPATFRTPDASLGKPSGFFSSPDSQDSLLEPLPQRTPQPAAQNRRAKELLEKQKDWVFLSPEDYDSESSGDNASGNSEYGPDGLEKKKKTPLERYYDRLEQSRVNVTNQIKSSDLFGLRNGGRGGDDSSLAAIENPWGAEWGNAEQTSKRTPNRRYDRAQVSVPDGDRGFSDFFGFGNSETFERTHAQETRMEEFKQLLQSHTLPSSAATGPDLFNGLTVSTPPGTVPGGLNDFSVSTPQPASVNPIPNTVGLPQRPLGLPDVTANPGFSSLTSVPLALEPLPRATLPPVTFSPPKRSF